MPRAELVERVARQPDPESQPVSERVAQQQVSGSQPVSDSGCRASGPTPPGLPSERGEGGLLLKTLASTAAALSIAGVVGAMTCAE